ncbi:hypothetical protein [Brevundimonas goettingensis]|uniref:Uncharacterized protein n=1 Tax=Brevundimonas goettingensis TaxID=2774190 RepID=A0A975C4T2_9CAUL|nr:hypothetical protein [Brevundimonas goettingensis]QTC91552.1 hypothetical protein IFJ75_01025 [Brevundimonas goettingensis]
MQPSKRKRGAWSSFGALGETAGILGLAVLAVVQGVGAAWGIIAGMIEMFRLMLGL